MSSDIVTGAFSGVESVKADLAKMTKDEDAATRRAMVKVSAELRRRVRANMAGRPGPNVRTGETRRKVHAVRPKARGGGEWTGKVSAMGGRQNLYVGRLEQRFPFMAPAVRTFDAKPIFQSEWDKAFKLRRG